MPELMIRYKGRRVNFHSLVEQVIECGLKRTTLRLMEEVRLTLPRFESIEEKIQYVETGRKRQRIAEEIRVHAQILLDQTLEAFEKYESTTSLWDAWGWQLRQQNTRKIKSYPAGATDNL